MALMERKKAQTEEMLQKLHVVKLPASEARNEWLERHGQPVTPATLSAEDLLRRPAIDLAALGELEQAKSADLDAVSVLFGQLMAALFTPEKDRWQATLAQLGNTLGRFIYVMDACLDQRSDEHHKRYNPITEFERVNGSFDGEQTLTMLIGDCALAFERLPLEQDLDLLRNILYSGVWTKWISAKQRNQPNRRNDPND